MYQSYFKIAWRNIIRDKQFSFLNLVGLSAGLACVLLIYLWVSDELNVDKFDKNDNHLYQVLKRNDDGNGAVEIGTTTQGMLAPSMAAELPEVEHATNFRMEREQSILSIADKKLKTNAAFAGKDFLAVFSYPLIEGDRSNALADVSGILLSDQVALKLFNTTHVAGKTIKLNLKDNAADFSNVYQIRGVFVSPPASATNQFDVLLPFELYAQKMAGGMGDVTFWGSNMASTYVLLKKGTNIDAFNEKIKGFSKAKIKSVNNIDEKYEGELFVQRYSDRYLHNNFVNGIPSGGRIDYVKLFSIIAVFILLIACINFMNLSTAKASRRMKEVGIKKVVGASRMSLVLQYISESILMAALSLLLALLLVVLLLPFFKQITGKDMSLLINSNLVISSLLITLITGVIAGSYPAFYLSGFKPISILKGTLKTATGETLIRKGLVVFQFSISVILMVAVIIVYQQMKLVQTTNLGYDKDNIIRFSNDGDLVKNYAAFLSEVKSVPGIVNASDVSGDLIGTYDHGGGGIDWSGKDPNLHIEYYGNAADNGFFETMNLQLAAGRTFSKDFADSASVLFNETAIAAMGLKNPVGKTVSLWGQKKTIIGVVKDYHFQSLYNKIGPAFFTFSNANPTTVVKIERGKERQALAGLKSLYSTYNPGLDFSYSFLDEDYNKLYSSEQRVAALSKYFAGITILISCLGLFGLAAFTAQKRQKEIGIRKVIGASVSSVVTMLSKDFLVLVSIALLIAIPASWWAANKWLQSFAYRVSISPLIFIATGALVIVMTLITISFQSIKAAIANPVKSLRTE